MIYLPSTSPVDWRRLLAEPDRQWKTGYSARSTAHCWEAAAPDFPPEIAAVLATEASLADVRPLLVLPEHQVPLDTRAAPSQNDVWVLGRDDRGLVSITVEAKAGESFGPTVSDWRPDSSPGKTRRLRFLLERLGLEGEVPGRLRYQLLHRTASALIEADRFHARRAVMLVHAFEAPAESRADFRFFVERFGAEAVERRVVHLGAPHGIDLFAGWVDGDPRFLSA